MSLSLFFSEIIKKIFGILGNICVDGDSPGRKEILKFNVIEMSAFIMQSSLIQRDATLDANLVWFLYNVTYRLDSSLIELFEKFNFLPSFLGLFLHSENQE
jgi:hypothetical protein